MKKDKGSQLPDKIVEILQSRFEKNPGRHKGIKWEAVKNKLTSNKAKLKVIEDMEKTGGEPDVTGYDKKTGSFIVCDCSPETPAGRRSLCYDQKALNSRKEFKPKNSAVKMAADMGVELLSEEEYMALKKLGEFDIKTSSWIKTPGEVRKQGGALFGDRRFGRVFVYHNGAESYYNSRGFRGIVRL